MDKAIDIYAFAMSIFEIVNRTTPWYGVYKTPMEVQKAVISGNMEPFKVNSKVKDPKLQMKQKKRLKIIPPCLI